MGHTIEHCVCMGALRQAKYSNKQQWRHKGVGALIFWESLVNFLPLVLLGCWIRCIWLVIPVRSG